MKGCRLALSRQRTNLVVADERAQRGSQALVVGLLGRCFPSPGGGGGSGGGCLLVVQLCLGCAVLERCLGRHAGLRCKERVLLLGQSEVGADECNWRSLLALGGATSQQAAWYLRGGVSWSERLGFSGVSSNRQALGRGGGRSWQGRSQAPLECSLLDERAAGGASTWFGVDGSGVWIPEMLKGDVIGKRSGSHFPGSGVRTTINRVSRHSNGRGGKSGQDWTRVAASRRLTAAEILDKCRGS